MGWRHFRENVDVARAGMQRTLAVAGLSLVTGTAAIGLAIGGVGPLGEVAASVRSAGAAMSRGVLSVVMPEAPATPPEAPGGDSSAARASRPAAPGPIKDDQPATPPAEPADASGGTLPDPTAGTAGEGEPASLLDAVSGAVQPPGAKTSGPEQSQTGGMVDVLGHLNGLTLGVLR